MHAGVCVRLLGTWEYKGDVVGCVGFVRGWVLRGECVHDWCKMRGEGDGTGRGVRGEREGE